MSPGGITTADPARALARILESLLTALATQPSHHATPQGEASRPRTIAYARMIVAEGLARLGSHARALELAGEAALVLDPVMQDPVHGYLAGAFVARIHQACAGRPRDSALPDQLAFLLESTSRVQRYKIDMLRQGSRILAPDRSIDAPEVAHDAIESFRRRIITDLASNTLRTSLRERDPASRATEIERLLEEHLIGAIFNNSSRNVIATCLESLLELPEAHAMPIVATLVSRIEPLRPAVPPDLCARLLAIVARFGFGEFVPDLAGCLRHAVRRSRATPFTLAIAFRAYRALGLREELHGLIDDVDAAIVVGAVPSATELLIAGARVWLADTRGELTFEMAQRALTQPAPAGEAGGRSTMSSRLDLVRALVAGASHTPIVFGIRQIEWVMPCLRHTTDSFSTCSHYSLSVLHFVESIVLGVTDLALSQEKLRDPSRSTGLGFRYGLDYVSGSFA